MLLYGRLGKALRSEMALDLLFLPSIVLLCIIKLMEHTVPQVGARGVAGESSGMGGSLHDAVAAVDRLRSRLAMQVWRAPPEAVEVCGRERSISVPYFSSFITGCSWIVC